MAKVSIITCAYNRQDYLAQTIESVLAQTFTDFEYLIWNNGSSDRTLEIAETYARTDPRIKVIDNSSNHGLAVGWDQSIKLSQGKYFCTVDSDDLIKPTALQQTVEILDNNPNIGVVYTKYHLINALGQDMGVGKRTNIPYSYENILDYFMTFHFRLVRRSAYDLTDGINPQQYYSVDYDLCLRLSEVANFYHLPEVLYSYRRHSNTMSQNPVAQSDCARQAVAYAKLRRSRSNRQTNN
jgi:glycosyltransferase involved in cell wall biosynthesis